MAVAEVAPAVDMVTIVSTGFAPTPLATAVVDTAVVVVVVADVVPPPDSDVGSGAAGITSHFGTSTINVNSLYEMYPLLSLSAKPNMVLTSSSFNLVY